MILQRKWPSMLKRIRIQNYKSLVDVDLTLDTLAVLVGPNAAGKSNVLDALHLLSRLATSRTLKEAFNPPYRGTPLESFTFGPRGIHGLLDQETASLSIEVEIALSETVCARVNQQIRDMQGIQPAHSDEPDTNTLALVRETRLCYRIDLDILPRSGILRVADEYLAALGTQNQSGELHDPFLKRVADRLHLRMEGQANPTSYARYLDHAILSLPLYPAHYPHLVAMRQELENWLFFYFEPRERMRATSPVKEVRHIGSMGQDLAAFLNTLKTMDERQFRAVEQSLHLVIPSITGITVAYIRVVCG